MHLRHLVCLSSLACALSTGACGGSARPEGAPAPAPERQRYVISIAEIQEGATQGIGNAYDLVVRLHPEWLRTTRSGTGNAASPAIWIDQQHWGGLNALRNLLLGGITQLRYLTPQEARGELGYDHPGGAIIVSTR